MPFSKINGFNTNGNESYNNNIIRDIDFKNFTYPSPDNVFWDELWLSKEAKKAHSDGTEYIYMKVPEFSLTNGKLLIKEDWVYEGPLPAQLILRDVHYSDFNHDGVLDALVEIEYQTRTASGKYQYLSYIFSIDNINNVILLDSFSGIPYDKKEGSLKHFSDITLPNTWGRFNVWIEDYKIYIRDDAGGPHCCPTHYVTCIGEYKNNELTWNYLITKIPK